MYKGVDLIIHVHVLNYNIWFPILGCSLMALVLFKTWGYIPYDL